MTDPRSIGAADLATGWLKTVMAVHALPGHEAVHVTTRIADPRSQDEGIRVAVDRLLEGYSLPSVERVANTLFPQAAAARLPEPSELARHYRDKLYPRIRRFPKNTHGTYFGRLVEVRGETEDQLSTLVRKLREASSGTAMKSRYELAVYDHARDGRKRLGFPCLSFASFHLAGGCLHASAVYRNHYLIERAYGNYLGLARLQAYVARAADLDVGELLVTAGHAEVERCSRAEMTALANLAASKIQPDTGTAPGQVRNGGEG